MFIPQMYHITKDLVGAKSSGLVVGRRQPFAYFIYCLFFNTRYIAPRYPEKTSDISLGLADPVRQPKPHFQNPSLPARKFPDFFGKPFLFTLIFHSFSNNVRSGSKNVNQCELINTVWLSVFRGILNGYPSIITTFESK